MSNTKTPFWKIPPITLNKYIKTSIRKVVVPKKIESEEEIKQAGTAICELTELYAYFKEMQLQARLIKRELKKNPKISSAEKADALSREEIFATYADIALKKYQLVSRMITIRQDVSKELAMLNLK